MNALCDIKLRDGYLTKDAMIDRLMLDIDSSVELYKPFFEEATAEQLRKYIDTPKSYRKENLVLEALVQADKDVNIDGVLDALKDLLDSMYNYNEIRGVLGE